MTNFQKILTGIVNSDPDTQKGVAEILGIKASYVSMLLKGKRLLSEPLAVKFGAAFGYDAAELLKIQALEKLGEMEKNLKTTNNQETQNINKTSDIAKSNGILREADKVALKVIVIPAKAQLGLQSFYYADELMRELETKTIYREKEYKGTYYEIECRGDSMYDDSEESIKNGDYILCRDISRMHWQNKLHINDWIFVIFHKELGIIVKQIKDHNTENGDLLLHSFNHNKKEFPDFTINLRDCEKICNIVEVRKVKKGKYGY